MTWRDTLLSSDAEMTCISRTKGKARVTINYYGDRNGVVRKVLEKGAIETREVYDKGLDDD